MNAAQATPGAGADIPGVLDGERPVDTEALVAIARDRIHLGVDYLQGGLRPIGTFYYIYDPVNDLLEDRQYNAVRHAGTTYALYQAHELLDDETSLTVGESAAEYIVRSMVPVRAAGKAYVDIQNGDTALGGQALALVALLERRRVTGNNDRDDLITDMATFLLFLEKDDHKGDFFFSFDHQSRLRLETPNVEYYPGEALLALTRLAAHFPDNDDYLNAAKRLATYMISKRDGDLARAKTLPREDHWLTIALSDLYRLAKKDDYVTVVMRETESMIGNQYTSKNGDPAQIGGARGNGPISNASTATKGEAMVAGWALAKLIDAKDDVARLAEATERNAQYQLRVQYTEANTQAFPRPEGAIGGWPGSTDDPTIRIDYVQHNLSVLVGLCHMLEDGDVPQVDASRF